MKKKKALFQPRQCTMSYDFNFELLPHSPHSRIDSQHLLLVSKPEKILAKLKFLSHNARVAEAENYFVAKETSLSKCYRGVTMIVLLLKENILINKAKFCQKLVVSLIIRRTFQPM